MPSARTPDRKWATVRVTYRLMLLHGISKLRHGVGGIETMMAAKGLPAAVAFGVYLGEVIAPALVLVGVVVRPAALVIMFALRQGGGALAVGDLFLFASVAVAAIGYAFSGRLTSQMPGWEVISWVLVIALPLSIPAAALTMPADISHIAVRPWLGLLYVALFSQWIGFFAWNAGLAIGGIARVSQIQLLQPFVTFALAAFFNAETITPQILLFAAAVVVTVAVSTRTRAKATPPLPQRGREPPQLAAS